MLRLEFNISTIKKDKLIKSSSHIKTFNMRAQNKFQKQSELSFFIFSFFC